MNEGMLGGFAERPLAARGLPAAAADPGQFVQVGKRVAHEGLRVALAFGQRRQPLRPAFERQPHRQQITRSHLPQPAKPGARIPQPRQRQQQRRHAQQGLHQRPGIAHPGHRHHGKRAQRHHHDEQRQHQPIDEVERGRCAALAAGGQKQDRQRQQRQAIAHRGLQPIGQRGATQALRQYPGQQQGKQIGQGEQVGQPLTAFGLRSRHRAHQPRQNCQPQRHHPGAVQQHQQRRHGKHRQREARLDARFAAHQRLPQQEQPIMRQQERARHRRLGIQHHGRVQGQQHQGQPAPGRHPSEQVDQRRQPGQSRRRHGAFSHVGARGGNERNSA